MIKKIIFSSLCLMSLSLFAQTELVGPPAPDRTPARVQAPEPDLKNPADCPPGEAQSQPAASELAADVVESVDELKKASIERGKALVQRDSKGKCLMCHAFGDEKSGFAYIPDAETFPDQAEEGKAYIRQIMGGFRDSFRGSLITDKSMPPMNTGLTDSEREDIRAYIENFAE